MLSADQTDALKVKDIVITPHNVWLVSIVLTESVSGRDEFIIFKTVKSNKFKLLML